MTQPGRTNRPTRRGTMLLEAMVGGTILAVGLAVLISLSSRSLAAQQFGEERIVAASLLDELLNQVLVEGPIDFQQGFDLRGTFEPPFEKYSFVIDLENQGDIEPYFVSATVLWESRGYTRSETIDTYIAVPRGEDTEEIRVPGEPIVR